MRRVGRCLAIAGKEMRHLVRDRLTLGMVFGIPALQLLLFGYAINTDVRQLACGVADRAQSQTSRAIVAAAEASQVVDVIATTTDVGELERWLETGRIKIGVVIPHDVERRLVDPTRPAAELLVDATDPLILSVANGLAELQAADFGRASRRVGSTVFSVRPYYNPERRSEVQIVPALIGVILTLTMTLFTAVAIVRERERGNLELLINTPVRTSELMIGKIIPYVGIGLIQVTVILLLGVGLFDVPIRGSLVDLYLAAFGFIVATLGYGLLVSTLARTQFQAFQITIFFFLPSLLLSGFMFPFDGMPRPARWLAELLPLTHFVRLVRAVVLRGASLGGLDHELWPLAAFFIVTMALAATRFSKRLD